MGLLNYLIRRKKNKQTTFCYCPRCNNELISSNSFVSDVKGIVKYRCSKCGEVSFFDFAHYPGPILRTCSDCAHLYYNSGGAAECECEDKCDPWLQIMYKVKGKVYKDIDGINYEIKEYEKEGGNTDFISDGAHTFGDLYEQRAYLFAAIVNLFPERSYKSWRHNNGERCFGSEDWFIVGIKTVEGWYTYHYEKKYWDLFKCAEWPMAPEWDGHTDKDVSRLLSLVE